MATRELSWTKCTAPTVGQPLRTTEGKRTLTAAEVARVNDAMVAMVVSTKGSCGADKPGYVVTVSSPRGDQALWDDFYQCGKSDKTYVTNIDRIFTALGALARDQESADAGVAERERMLLAFLPLFQPLPHVVPPALGQRGRCSA